MFYRGIWALVVVCAIHHLVPQAVGKEPSGNAALAEQFVEFALNSELDGRASGRSALLERALAIDPHCRRARWHSGYLRWKGAWRTVAEVEASMADDKRLAKYAKKRTEYANTPAAQLALARWCADSGLIAQGQLHTAQAINAWKGVPPLEREMADKLGFQQVGDGSDAFFVSREAVAEQIEEAQESAERWQHWSAELSKIRQLVESRSQQRRDLALSQLREISDPAAIPALEALISTAGKEMSLEVVALLGNVPQHRATMSLARHAVFAPHEEVRVAATELLGKRRLHDYVPHLLAQLSSPVKSRFRVQPLPDGSLRYFHDFYRAGANEDHILRKNAVFAQIGGTRHIMLRPAFGWRYDSGAVPESGDESAEVLAAVQMKIRERERQVAAKNQQAALLNGRIDAVLKTTTGENLNADPVKWWQWWQRYNELHTADQKQLVAYYTNRRLSFYKSTERVQVTYIPSCFPAGTLVSTLTGRKPIETIRAGDFVLSQHPDTGELAYKIVLGTTIRPPTKLVEIRHREGELSATLGHPLWVSGYGWRMAKFVEAGDLLHGAGGSVVVDEVEEIPPEVAYNLIVDDFSTYLVGDEGLLVHDNTLRKPTLAVLPGLVK